MIPQESTSLAWAEAFYKPCSVTVSIFHEICLPESNCQYTQNYPIPYQRKNEKVN
jgi:hypothetical protein